jgi:hypothetical protein
LLFQAPSKAAGKRGHSERSGRVFSSADFSPRGHAVEESLYDVSVSGGKRVIYFGRNGQFHVEEFPRR